MAKLVTRSRQEIYDRWIDALESGRYRQTAGRLRRKTSNKSYGYCCLGVLCNLASQDGGPKWEANPHSEWKGNICFDGSYSRLPAAMQKVLGMTDPECQLLMTLNDSGKQSFKQIAEHIRTYIKPVALTRD